jgi:periplasmic protein TonB
VLQGKLNQANRLRAEAIRQQELALREKRAAEQAARVAATEQAAREAAQAEKQRIEEQARVAAAARAQTQQQRTPALANTETAAAQSDNIVPIPKPSNTTPTATAASGSLQKLLKLKRYQAPDYPPEAATRGVGGVVTVAFTVDVKGTTRDIKVTASNPEKLFDRAAVAAVRRWRYDPVEVNGVPTEIPTTLAIRFAPPTQ